MRAHNFCIAYLTFSIIAEAHLSLSKTNCVFPLTNAIELLELGLVNALRKTALALLDKILHMTEAMSEKAEHTWLGK